MADTYPEYEIDDRESPTDWLIYAPNSNSIENQMAYQREKHQRQKTAYCYCGVPEAGRFRFDDTADFRGDIGERGITRYQWRFGCGLDRDIFFLIAHYLARSLVKTFPISDWGF